jgi:FkbM family methyltransferase
MNSKLQEILINILRLIGVFPTVLSNKKDIIELIKKLRPISTDKELIRLGSKGDGGYLVPNDLEGISACFSPGVDKTSDFELECAELGMEVYLADKSVDQPAINHSKFHFTKKFIGATNNEQFMTLDKWVEISINEAESELLLQMDIEGYEYETLLNISDHLLRRFRVIIIEFHSLHMLWSQPFYKVASTVFEILLKNHSCVHIHPNNYNGVIKTQGIQIPKAMEFTFLRKERIKDSSPIDNLPHKLDQHNSSKKPISLAKYWYNS